MGLMLEAGPAAAIVEELPTHSFNALNRLRVRYPNRMATRRRIAPAGRVGGKAIQY